MARTSTPGRSPWSRIPLGVVAVACLALACAAVYQHRFGWNEYSHFDQVRAFDHGTASIDRYRRSTGDRAYYHGHYYSDKAPGMGLFLLPAYHVAVATGVVHRAGIGAIHLMVVFGCVLPVTIILLLGLWLVRRRDPGQGAAVAISLGLGTLLLPFATLLFSHVLSAGLGFAAFCLLWREREREGEPERKPHLGFIVVAGVLAGYAIAVEYPLVLLVGVLGLYAASFRAPANTVLAYGGGVAIGLVPLLLYDWWAFGSPLHISYASVAANSSGILGLGWPSLRVAVRLLVSNRGLFVVTPVVAAAIAGIVVLYREGRRMDALVPAVVAAAYFFYNICYYLPFGGAVPGPRFLITMLPFLAVPLAAAYREAPIATLSLAAASAATMAAATLTLPVLAIQSSTRVWWNMLTSGHFGTPDANVAVFAVLAVLAILVAASATPKPAVGALARPRRDLELAVLGVGSWFALRSAGPTLLGQDHATGEAWGLAVLIVVGVVLIAVITCVARGYGFAWVAGIPVVALAARRFDHTTAALGLAAISAALLIAVASTRRTMVLADREP
ncbi:MAG: hypothetical protein M3071_18630 [Actinomycetota bacterium]|nr:hypothetical protein [Actinomycetota bacterium]